MKNLTFLMIFIPISAFGQECDVVAKVFSENICRSEITTSYKGKVIKKYKDQAEQEKLILQINKIAIKNLIKKETYEVKK